MKKILFIDRDGTLVIEPKDNYQIDSLEKLEFFPGVFQYLSRIAVELDFSLVMVTNQDGMGTDSFPEKDFEKVQEKIIRAFTNEDVLFDEVLIDKSFPHENLPTRKPGTAMLTHYIKGNFDLKNSFVIGDRITDVQLAKNLGCGSILLSENPGSEADLVTNNWKIIYEFLKKKPRTSSVSRKTKETNISVDINLNGSGLCEIDTGLGFFNHLLEQLGKHGNLDLKIKVDGDLFVDEHHTIEDTAICLGEALKQAIGSKKGIERYGYLLPMDESLAQVAIDFGGRPWLVWEADFKREKIGEMPCEMFMHFFKSFSDNALCNLNIKAEGDNEHHKIEAVFKAFARALKMAVEVKDNFSIPSTKGCL